MPSGYPGPPPPTPALVQLCPPPCLASLPSTLPYLSQPSPPPGSIPPIPSRPSPSRCGPPSLASWSSLVTSCSHARACDVQRPSSVASLPAPVPDFRAAPLPFHSTSRAPHLLCWQQEIGYIKSLRELHASDNKIFVFNVDITGWDRLEVLDVSGNPLEYLPASIGLLPALQELNVMRIPELRIPASVMKVSCNGGASVGRLGFITPRPEVERSV